MIYYNVTVKIDHSIKEDWLKWMQEKHIPDVMKTGFFKENKICRLLDQDESNGITYSIQYACETLCKYETYQKECAPALQAEHTQRYEGKFVAFRTLMEKVG